MFALQTASPPTGPAFAALLVLALVGMLGGAVGDAVVRRLPNPVSKYRLLYAAGLFPVTLLAYWLLSSLGLGPALLAALPVRPGPLTPSLADFLEFLAAGFVWLAAYAPTVRGVREVRDIELSTSRSLAKMTRYVVVLSAVVTVAVAPLRLAPGGVSPLVAAIELALVGSCFGYGSPWLLPVLRSVREPAGETVGRLAALRDRAGLDVRDVRVLDTDDEETANAIVRGPPGYRRLIVTSTFLERFDDDTAAALLAIETGRLRSRVLEIRVGTVLVSGLTLVAAVAEWLPRWVIVVALATLLVGVWLSRRGIRAADDYAAQTVSPDVVADALRRYADAHAMDPTRRRLSNPLSANVALGDRIDRIERHETG